MSNVRNDIRTPIGNVMCHEDTFNFTPYGTCNATFYDDRTLKLYLEQSSLPSEAWNQKYIFENDRKLDSIIGTVTCHENTFNFTPYGTCNTTFYNGYTLKLYPQYELPPQARNEKIIQNYY